MNRRIPEEQSTTTKPAGSERSEAMARLSSKTGLRRIAMLAWRDLDDPEAGGSELHAHKIASCWAAAGIDVVMRTSAVAGGPEVARRDGYAAVRRSGRYRVFADAPLDICAGRRGPVGRVDGLVEIWNGMPFMSPLWWRGPKLVFLHHVHGEMWQMVLPSHLAAAGSTFEARVAPLLYRRTRVVTLSDSSRREIIGSLRMRPELVSVVPPGIDRRFRPGPASPGMPDRPPSPGMPDGPASPDDGARGIGGKADHPLIVAVGRLVPVKRFDRVISAAQPLAARCPGVEIVIVGEGYERPVLEAAIEDAGVGGTVRLAGHLGADELVRLYQRAWVLVAMSAREGWGMTVTEAAACGTPAVVSRIAGHLDAVEHGVTGFLVDDEHQFVTVLDQVLSDAALRAELSRAALSRAQRYCWEVTALLTLQLLAHEAQAVSR